jgi:ABC-type multidrug transport system fused ATPase/permease subunit
LEAVSCVSVDDDDYATTTMSNTPGEPGDGSKDQKGRPGLDKAKTRRRSSLYDIQQDQNFLASFHQVQQDAMPWAKAWSWDTFLSFFTCDPNRTSMTKVSLTKLLSFSTRKERYLMAFGVLLATFSGLGIPVWLGLLARSLDTFSSLGRLIDEVGGEELFDFLRQELNKMCIAFGIVGLVSLVTGSLYVSIWTYLGEKQALRIQKAFVRSAMNQDAAWFDENDREALPTKMSTSLVHVNAAIGRQIVDVYSLAVSSVGCLVVALLLNTALSLIMLCVIPVVALVMVVINWFVRNRNKEGAAELALAGSIATEVIAGIKTVFALCSQKFFFKQYSDHLARSERRQTRSIFLSSLLAGLTGLIFYATYMISFYIGTQQVISGAETSLIIKCFLSGEPGCRVTGASVMCSIYGVILCVTFVGLLTPGLATVNRGRNAAATIFAAIDRVPPIDPTSEDGAKREQLEGKLEFRSLHFAYPSRQKPVLFNFNLTVQAGQSVALVGPSGSGKST